MEDGPAAVFGLGGGSGCRRSRVQPLGSINDYSSTPLPGPIPDLGIICHHGDLSSGFGRNGDGLGGHRASQQ